MPWGYKKDRLKIRILTVETQTHECVNIGSFSKSDIKIN